MDTTGTHSNNSRQNGSVFKELINSNDTALLLETTANELAMDDQYE